MATLDFSRAVEQDLQTLDDRKFYANLIYTRDDSGAVDFSGKTIKMEIYTQRGETLVDTLTSGTEITISTDELLISKTLTALSIRAYYFQIFNDTDKEGIQRGNLIVI